LRNFLNTSCIQKEEEERQEKKMKMVKRLMKRTKQKEKAKVEKNMIELYIKVKRKEGNIVELWYKYMEEKIDEIKRVKEEQKKGDKAAREILNKRILEATKDEREALRSRNKRATKIYLLFHQLGQIDRIREVECNMVEIDEFKREEIEWIVKEVLRREKEESSQVHHEPNKQKKRKRNEDRDIQTLEGREVEELKENRIILKKRKIEVNNQLEISLINEEELTYEEFLRIDKEWRRKQDERRRQEIMELD